MKRLKKIRIGGIGGKLFIMSLLTVAMLTAAFIGISLSSHNTLQKLVGESQEKQQETISEITGEVMNQVVEQNLGRANRTEARFADELFAEARSGIIHLVDCATRLFAQPEAFNAHTYDPPRGEDDGKWTAKVLYADRVDENDPALTAKLSLLANMSDTMISLCQSFDVANAYIGLPEGAFLSVSTNSSSWISNGKPRRDYDPRGRMWYLEAVKAGNVIFTDGEWDANTGEYCIECAMPVYDPEGNLQAVIGMDLYLNEIQQVLSDSSVEGESNLLVNQYGKAVLPMQAEVFPMPAEERNMDLRESRYDLLSQAVGDALAGREMNVMLGQLDDGNYYVIATPIETTGWVLVSAYSQAVSGRAETLLRRSLAEVQDEATAEYKAMTSRTQKLAGLLLIAGMALALGGVMILGRRIVKPLNMITRRISGISESNLEFVMEDEFRTGDEVEKLAESFAAVSRRTIDYMDRVVKVTAEKERIGTELSLANQIQNTMLPHLFPAFPERNEFDIFASMDPAKEVGGDFYDYFLIDDDHLGLVMADVSGKGVPAALFMMASKIIISNNVMMGKTPAQVLSDTNMALCANGQEDMFVTVWIGILEISTGKLTAANGGHEYPVLMRDGRFELYKDIHGFLVGGMPGIRYMDYEIQMKPGDKLFLYTDGIPEAHNNEKVMFGLDRMVNALNEKKNGTPWEVLIHMREAVDTFVGNAEQFDDLTMLCLEYKNKQEEENA